MKKIVGVTIGVIVVAIVVIILIMFFRGKGLGNGSGSGGDSKDLLSVGKDTETGEKSKADQKEGEDESEEEREDLSVPDEIIVRIVEDQVTINEIPVNDSDELKQKINEYNRDGRTFKLEEERSILATYEWVTEAFDDLEIFLKNK